MNMTHLKLIAGAVALEGWRAARQHLYSLLVLTPLILPVLLGAVFGGQFVAVQRVKR
jgi:hypothetical protein